MSPTMKEMKDALNKSVTPEIRALHLDLTGMRSSDEDIWKWYCERLFTKPSVSVTSTGGKTDFYNIEGCKDVDDLAEHWNLRGDEFNCLKAIAGIALGSRHLGTSPIRDANKLLHYAQRIVARLNKETND